MAKQTVKLTNKITNGNLLFNYDTSYLITKVDWGTIDVTQAMDKYYDQIGESIAAVSINRRIVTITGYVIGETKDILDYRKKHLEVTANPLQDIRMDVNDLFIEGKPRTPVRFSAEQQENNDVFCLFQLEVLCGYSMFKSGQMVRDYVSQWESMLEWDLEFPLDPDTLEEIGIEIEVRGTDLIKNLINSGDVFAPMYIEFTALAEVVNPYIVRIDDQKYIKILTTMQTGDKIFVDTNPAAQYQIQLLRNSVYSNIYRLRDRGSTLNIGLNVGDNLYRYGADTEEQEELLEVVVYRYNIFWGCNWIA